MKTFNLLRKNGTKIENEFQANDSEILGVIFSGFGYMNYNMAIIRYQQTIQ